MALGPARDLEQPDVLFLDHRSQIVLVGGDPLQRGLARARAVEIQVEDDVAHAALAQDGEPFRIGEGRQRYGDLDEVRRDVVAVAVHHRPPVRGRAEHVFRVSEEISRRVEERKLGNDAETRLRERFVRLRERIDFPERHRRPHVQRCERQAARRDEPPRGGAAR